MTLVFDIRDLTLPIPALPQPTVLELKTGCADKRPWIRSIVRDHSHIDPVRLQVGRIVKPDEESIDELTYVRRLGESSHMSLGFQHARWLQENRNNLPQQAREMIDKIIPGNFIDFPGLIIERADGSRGVPVLCQNWDVHFAPLSFVFHRRLAFGKV